MTYGEVMKRQLLRRMICTLAAAVVMIICSMPAFALHNWASSYSLDIELENAPENAAYVDILVPAKNFGIDEFEDFHDTKITNYDKPAANIDKNSEIVNYIDDDGFISLSAHTDAVSHIDLQIFRSSINGGKIIGGDIILKKDENEHDANWLKDNFGSIKIAFVDKDGKVISVTDKASFHTVIDQESPGFSSKDSKGLKFGTHAHYTTFENIVIMILLLAILVVGVMLTRGIIKGLQKQIKERRNAKRITKTYKIYLDKE